MSTPTSTGSASLAYQHAVPNTTRHTATPMRPPIPQSAPAPIPRPRTLPSASGQRDDCRCSQCRTLLLNSILLRITSTMPLHKALLHSCFFEALEVCKSLNS